MKQIAQDNMHCRLAYHYHKFCCRQGDALQWGIGNCRTETMATENKDESIPRYYQRKGYCLRWNQKIYIKQ